MTGTERKVFQKYYPPDFDPRKLPKAKGVRNRQFVQRVMAPYNMICNTCGEYVYKGKKFNMRRETAEGETYLGLKIFRFYFRCPNCLAEITFKTDLENCDYAQEHGATRLFEAYRLMQEQDKEIEKKEQEDASNPMKMVEKRTKMSRAEMEALGNLEELRELNRRQSTVDYDALLDEYKMNEAEQLRRQEEEDEQFVKSIFGSKDKDKPKVKRIVEEDEEVDEKPGPSSSGGDSLLPLPSVSFTNERKKTRPEQPRKNLLQGMVVVKKKPKLELKSSPKTDEPSTSAPDATSTSGMALLGDYGGSSSDSE